MILLRKAAAGIALVALGYYLGKNSAEIDFKRDFHLVPKDSYCIQFDVPLSQYFMDNFSDSMKPQEIYTSLELMAKECGR